MGLRIVSGSLRALLAASLLALGFASGASAQPALYTAGNILVDVTGDIANLRDQAMLQAQRQALQQVLNEIAPAADVARVALPGDEVISGWVQDFAIDEEKISANRYIGRFTFRFQAEPIRTLLSDNGISFAEAQTKTVLIVPVFTDDQGQSVLWGPTNQWLAAWAANAPSSTLLRYVVPIGDPTDTMSLAPVEALAGDTAKLEAMAQRYGAAEVAVAEAALLPATADGARALAISVTRPGATGQPPIRDQVAGDGQDIDALMRQGVVRTATLLQGAWRDANLIDANIQGEITVDVPVADLKEWVSVKRQLAKVQSLRGARLVSLKKSLAEMELNYIGTEEQFARALAEQNLALDVSGEGQGILKFDPSAASKLPTAEPGAPTPSSVDDPAAVPAAVPQ
jgi:hypothetical protein